MKLPLPDEISLINGCIQNDRRSQECVYQKYEKRMYGLCLRYLADRAEAQDALVSGFLKVFQQISAFKQVGSFEGWVRQIMINESLGRLRKLRSLPIKEDLDYIEQTSEASFWPDQTLETADLLGMILQMPTGYRTVFNLYAIEGYSHKEIAEQLSIDEQSSKSQLSRARKWLQVHIAKLEILPIRAY